MEAWHLQQCCPEPSVLTSPHCTAGLKFGIYSDAGLTTCLGYPGGRFFEDSDAESFASWDVDFLKYDNCAAVASDWVVDRYVAMRNALNSTGRPILYSLCVWGVADPWIWAQDVRHLLAVVLRL